MGKKTLGAQVHEDSGLYQRFEEFEEDYETRSEAVRAAIRRGIRDRESSSQDDAASSQGRYTKLQGGLLNAAGILALITVLAVSFGVLFSTLGIIIWQIAVISTIYSVLALLTAVVLYWYEHGTIDSAALSPGAKA